jgi:hypothetical protein
MYFQKVGPRAEYRHQEAQRVRDSATLAETFAEVKSLTVDLSYFAPASMTRLSQLKYTVNLSNAKSLFRFNCPNDECVGGDFDLSAALANAVTAHHSTVTGEVICQGWRSKSSVHVPCGHILRYELNIGY